MIIGYDAKRAFQNRTGLGNYSRTLLRSLDACYKQHYYYLFAPKRTRLFNIDGTECIRVFTPKWQPAKLFPSLWRSAWITRDLKATNVDIYHGLSNEIPMGMHKTGIRSVVTIHDLIFELYPQQYHRTEVWTYKKKFRYACRHADAIIATSEHTKKDIVDIYDIHPDKIHVCYQSCSDAYWRSLQPDELSLIKEQYHLPENYFLYVGSITERKNLLAVCQAMYAIRDALQIPLVVVGEGKQYKKKVQQWLAAHGLSRRVFFLSDTEAAKNSAAYRSGLHFPGIYQNARAVVFPSIYEGFGIPVLEGLISGVPVIAARSSSLPEVGGKAALYFDPGDVDGLADCMLQAAFNESVRQQCVQEAQQQILQFTPQISAERVMQVYRTLI